jgi:hypothetical protein
MISCWRADGDGREVDSLTQILVGEITGKLVFSHFTDLIRERTLIRCLQDDTEDSSPPGLPTSIPNDDPLAANPDLAIVESSKSAKIIQDALQSIFDPMEICYLRTLIDKVGPKTSRLSHDPKADDALGPPRCFPGASARHTRYIIPTLPLHRSRRHLPSPGPSPPFAPPATSSTAKASSAKWTASTRASKASAAASVPTLWGSRLRGDIDCQVLFGKSASRYTKTSGKMNKQT